MSTPPEPAQWIASPRAIAIWNRASAAYNRKVTDKLWSEAAALEIDEALKEIDDEHARRHAPASVDGEVVDILRNLVVFCEGINKELKERADIDFKGTNYLASIEAAKVWLAKLRGQAT